jgi:hypothetical protein
MSVNQLRTDVRLFFRYGLKFWWIDAKYTVMTPIIRALRWTKNRMRVWVARHMWWLLPLSLLVDFLFMEM